jgi:hypothetical protein
MPQENHAEEIREMGIRLILSMHWQRPHASVGADPVNLLWLPTLDTPLVPMSLKSLRKGVEASLPVIQAGDSVLVHCRYGVHRSVAMACCVLIGQGYNSEDAMSLVKEKRAVADPDIWYIRARIIKFENLPNHYLVEVTGFRKKGCLGGLARNTLQMQVHLDEAGR